MGAWFIADKIDISDKKLWKIYCLTGLELLLKSDYFAYSDNEFFVQMFRSHKWTWIEKEMKIVYLGMGAEFYLKALYLKNGFSIRQINSHSIYPEKKRMKNESLFIDRSITFQQMIEDENLRLILSQEEIKISRPGLKIIQGWRNTVLHSVSLVRFQTNIDFKSVITPINILHSLLIKSEKRLISNIKHIITPWSKDRYPDGKFMKRETPTKRELILPVPPLGYSKKVKKINKADAGIEEQLQKFMKKL